MSTYTPDRWVVVELTDSAGEKHQRVFAGWLGGYTYGGSWKMNSGIQYFTIDGDTFEFHGTSGSVYRCRKDLYGMSMYMQSVFKSFEAENSDTGGSIKIAEGYPEISECPN